jgi:hypothetical protein
VPQVIAHAVGRRQVAPLGVYQEAAAGAWTLMPGAAVAIDVGPQGPWVVNDGGYTFAWQGSGWVNVPGGGTDIGAGANGSVWIIGTTKIANGPITKISRSPARSWPISSESRVQAGPGGDPPGRAPQRRSAPAQGPQWVRCSPAHPGQRCELGPLGGAVPVPGHAAIPRR